MHLGYRRAQITAAVSGWGGHAIVEVLQERLKWVWNGKMAVRVEGPCSMVKPQEPNLCGYPIWVIRLLRPSTKATMTTLPMSVLV